jgi:hypothetical protein
MVPVVPLMGMGQSLTQSRRNMNVKMDTSVLVCEVAPSHFASCVLADIDSYLSLLCGSLRITRDQKIPSEARCEIALSRVP